MLCENKKILQSFVANKNSSMLGISFSGLPLCLHAPLKYIEPPFMLILMTQHEI